MKKLLSFLILSFVLAPAFVFADAGGAGQGNEIPSPLDCEGYFECVCNTSAPQTDYLPVSTTATTPEACNSYCQGLTDPTTYDWSCWLGGSVMFNGVSRLEESGVIGDSASATTSAPTVPAEAPAQPLIPILNVPIPGLDWSKATTVSNGQQHSNLLGAYVNAVYAYMLGAAALIAVTMLMIAGLQYATARGDSKQVDNAKKRINNAVVGIILLLLAYNIAFIVNPATVKFKSLDIQVIKGIEVDDETPVNFS
ncbi:MAG: hypothetical protein QG626_613, partial [Patescibacteria group bacterium]|nr:hypothetical protein [Patescibacteria group bacterium]